MKEFKDLLTGIVPMTLKTDKGLEFLNRALQALLKEHGVGRFLTRRQRRASSNGSVAYMEVLYETSDGVVHQHAT